MFGLDILVSFFTVYLDDLDKPVLDYRLIAVHYLRSWFLVDFLSTIPIDALLQLVDGDVDVSSIKLLRILRLARLLKMVRLLKINKLLEGTDGLQVRCSLTRSVMAIFLTWLVVLVCRIS